MKGLPNAWIGVGTVDLFYAEDKEYANRLREAGVEVDLLEVKGAWHAFDGMVPKAKVFIDFNKSRIEAYRKEFGLDRKERL